MAQNLQLGNKTLEYISMIAKTGSFSKAAKVLYVSQPALSKYIKNLEQRIGSPIFYRRNEKVVPTYLGEQMLSYINQILPLEREMELSLQNIREGSGLCRIALPHLWSALLLPEIIESLRANFPRLELVIDEVSASDVLEGMLLHHEIDIAIMRDHVHSEKLASAFYRRDEIVLIIAKDHPLVEKAVPVQDRRYPVISPALLSELSFILQRPSQIIRKHVDAIFSNEGIIPNVELTLRSIEASIKLVHGNVACFGTETHIRNITNPDRLSFLCLDTPESSLDLHLFYLNSDHISETLKEVIHFLSVQSSLV